MNKLNLEHLAIAQGVHPGMAFGRDVFVETAIHNAGLAPISVTNETVAVTDGLIRGYSATLIMHGGVTAEVVYSVVPLGDGEQQYHRVEVTGSNNNNFVVEKRTRLDRVPGDGGHPTPSSTPTPTASVSVSKTPSPTPSPTVTASASGTPIPVVSNTPTPSVTGSSTPPPTPTSTATPTPSGTATLPPTPTPTPSPSSLSIVSPSELFAGGELGAWYKPGTGSYQDAGGTIQHTGVSQPYGRINDLSGNNNTATQTTTTARPVQPANMPLRLRTDFTDDAIIAPLLYPTLEMWVNTPYGHYRTNVRSGQHSLPLNDATEIVARANLSPAQRQALSRYFGTTEYEAIYLSPDTTVTLLHQPVSGTSPAVITFIGDNGVTVTETWPSNTKTMDLSTAGLTGRVAVCLHHGFDGQIIDIKANLLAGTIPDLTANVEMTTFNCSNNKLTGSIPDLSSNTALSTFNCQDNQLTGSIPSLVANTALKDLRCSNNQLTGSIPSLAANTSLQIFIASNNQLTGSIPNLSSNTVLTRFDCPNNQLTGWAGGTIPKSLGSIGIGGNNLSSTVINSLLRALVVAGRTSADGTAFLNFTGNAAPTGQGITDKNTLISRGWTVYPS